MKLNFYTRFMKEFAIGALIILAIFQYNTNQELSKRVKSLETLTTSQEEEISKLNDLAVSYDEALTEANNTIEEANSSIETAKYDAWNDYDSMGDALDTLDTFDTVAAPDYTPYEYQLN